MKVANIQRGGGLAGERDSEVGRKIERGSPSDITAQRRKAMQAHLRTQKKKNTKDWELEKEKLAVKDIVEFFFNNLFLPV